MLRRYAKDNLLFTYDQDYIKVFHSPGVEPWITGLLKVVRPRSVLDVGCGFGF